MHGAFVSSMLMREFGMNNYVMPFASLNMVLCQQHVEARVRCDKSGHACRFIAPLAVSHWNTPRTSEQVGVRSPRARRNSDTSVLLHDSMRYVNSKHLYLKRVLL